MAGQKITGDACAEYLKGVESGGCLKGASGESPVNQLYAEMLVHPVVQADDPRIESPPANMQLEV